MELKEKNVLNCCPWILKGCNYIFVFPSLFFIDKIFVWYPNCNSIKVFLVLHQISHFHLSILQPESCIRWVKKVVAWSKISTHHRPWRKGRWRRGRPGRLGTKQSAVVFSTWQDCTLKTSKFHPPTQTVYQPKLHHLTSCCHTFFRNQITFNLSRVYVAFICPIYQIIFSQKDRLSKIPNLDS